MLKPEIPSSEPEAGHSSSLWRDRAFWGLNLTQFLGAFNDNLFKQLVMLICIDLAKNGGRDWQGLAMIVFSWPFIAFSGFAGFLSDRFSKRTIIVICKAAEFLIVLLGLVGFSTGSLAALFGVLCLMGVHSAFFGPSKYGILPEILKPADLPRANGMILMATFLAIILGLPAAGAAKQLFEPALWVASLPCLVIALAGLGTSLLIRPTPVAQPQLQFRWSSVAISAETRMALRDNRTLLGVLLMSSVFWFVGGTVYPPAINAFGKDQFRLSDLTTGMMAASTGLGIAVGCVLAGILSKNRVRSWLVRTGAWGLTISLAAVCLPGPGANPVRDEIRANKGPKDQRRMIRNYTVANNDSQRQQIIGQCLAIRISLHPNETPLSSVLDEISDQLGIQVVCDSTAIGIDLDSKATANLNQVSVKKALDTLFEGHPVVYGSDPDVLLIGSASRPPKNSEQTMSAFRDADFHRGCLLGPYGSVVALIAVGVSAGFFTVPLQVYLQTAAPDDQKGRIIGAWNLLNWIGIAGAGFVYLIGWQILVGWLELPHGSLFGFAAVLMLPVAVFYRPPETRAT